MTADEFRVACRARLKTAGWTETKPYAFGREGKTATLWEQPGWQEGQPRCGLAAALRAQIYEDLRGEDDS